jgi:hypothetical protein
MPGPPSFPRFSKEGGQGEVDGACCEFSKEDIYGKASQPAARYTAQEKGRCSR